MSSVGLGEKEINLHKRSIGNLLELEGEYDAVIVCLGARSTFIHELSGKLPLRTCRGIIAHLHLPDNIREEFPEHSPSILSDAWLAIQNPRNVYMGSTWEWKSINYSQNVSIEEASKALEELLPKASAVYPGVTKWSFNGASAGLRAMPPLTAPKKITKEVGKIDNLFASYANASINMIDPEGVEKLCSDLNVDHTDVRILMLAWKMKANKQGYFTQDEWRLGLKALHADTIKKLKSKLPELQKELSKQENFDDFYSFSFRYCLTEDKQKTLDIESVCMLLELVLGPSFRLQVDSLVEYLKIQMEYKVINMDQWTNILRFCQEIEFPDLKKYDDCQAWALILDNYVEWLREKSVSA